ncbi:hypothetical protein B9Z19DRAFT_1067407 [Tuber borchii]|uniref:Uncharacterized protein n=1 Tax=Tuber borchii TaxID=42251 RepID=A0A2T6ZIY0_TUBBO|nr:hypothetical protein B9Z19DRAFT_1067407 [Tuber borchii]
MATEILTTITQMLENHQPEVLIFEDLNPSVAVEILSTLQKPTFKTGLEPDLRGFRLHYSSHELFLKVVMPTWFHERPIMWLRTELGRWMDEGFLQFRHYKAINDGTSTFSNFVGVYTGSSKIPDVAWIPCIDHRLKVYPSVVLESGWAESAPRLWEDCNLWMTGTAGAVHVVILCKIFYPNSERKSVFPAPKPKDEGPGPYITVSELFSSSTPSGLTPTTRLPLSLEFLRDKLRTTFHEHGFLAA